MKKRLKRFASLVLGLVMVMGLAMPVMAAPIIDVAGVGGEIRNPGDNFVIEVLPDGSVNFVGYDFNIHISHVERISTILFEGGEFVDIGMGNRGWRAAIVDRSLVWIPATGATVTFTVNPETVDVSEHIIDEHGTLLGQINHNGEFVQHWQNQVWYEDGGSYELWVIQYDERHGQGAFERAVAAGRTGLFYMETEVFIVYYDGIFIRDGGGVGGHVSAPANLGNYVVTFSATTVGQARYGDHIDWLNSPLNWGNAEFLFVIAAPLTEDETSAATPPTGAPNLNTASNWAHDSINRAFDLGLIPQSLQNNYTANATRVEFAAFAVALYETATGREIAGRAEFNDTNDINVQKMGYLEVVTGVGGGNFAPNDGLTREQAAVMIARLAYAIGQSLPQAAPTFADNAQISSWAVDAVGQMQAAGIMGGVGDNQFAPSGDYTREQSIITMLRLFEILQ